MGHRLLLFTLAVVILSALAPCARTQQARRVPLTDLGTGLYQSFPGGLYPGGMNTRPSQHDSAGTAIARSITPLNADGIADDRTGAIVLLSIGMSNTTQEFSVFKPMADSDDSKNPRLKIVDGAQGGQTAAIIANPGAAFWTIIDQRITAAGATRLQVQAACIKEADSNPSKAFPVHAQALEAELETIARILKVKYPNLKVAFVSSRTYGGYATSTLNPEPYAFESGFAVKWLIEKQITGDTSLAYSGPAARAPWLAWGPYLWADGLSPRSDGLVWEAADFVTTDGTHPSTSGRQKVASMLLAFMKTDPAAAPWFLKHTATSQARDVQNIRSYALSQNYPNPFNPATSITFRIPVRSFVSLRIVDALGRNVASLAAEELSPGAYTRHWNAAGNASGMYYALFRAGTYSQYKKLLLIR